MVGLLGRGRQAAASVSVTSFLQPSPSWLNRNQKVRGTERKTRQDHGPRKPSLVPRLLSSLRAGPAGPQWQIPSGERGACEGGQPPIRVFNAPWGDRSRAGLTRCLSHPTGPLDPQSLPVGAPTLCRVAGEPWFPWEPLLSCFLTTELLCSGTKKSGHRGLPIPRALAGWPVRAVREQRGLGSCFCTESPPGSSFPGRLPPLRPGAPSRRGLARGDSGFGVHFSPRTSQQTILFHKVLTICLIRRLPFYISRN